MSPATCGKRKVFSDHRLFFIIFIFNTDTVTSGTLYYLAKREKQTLVLLNLNCLCNDRQPSDTVIIFASKKKLLAQSRCLKSVKLRRRSQLLQGKVSIYITNIHQKQVFQINKINAHKTAKMSSEI